MSFLLKPISNQFLKMDTSCVFVSSEKSPKFDYVKIYVIKHIKKVKPRAYLFVHEVYPTKTAR